MALTELDFITQEILELRIQYPMHKISGGLTIYDHQEKAQYWIGADPKKDERCECCGQLKAGSTKSVFVCGKETLGEALADVIRQLNDIYNAQEKEK